MHVSIYILCEEVMVMQRNIFAADTVSPCNEAFGHPASQWKELAKTPLPWLLSVLICMLPACPDESVPSTCYVQKFVHSASHGHPFLCRVVILLHLWRKLMAIMLGCSMNFEFMRQALRP
eukprot:1160435-Pelagomonas_calceolata.AAC.2